MLIELLVKLHIYNNISLIQRPNKNMDYDEDEHVQPLLGDDDQPSWVSLANDDEKNNTSASADRTATSINPWDQAAARMSNRTNGNGNSNSDTWLDPDRDKKEDDLPRIILLMRLGNLGAAGLLIFGSVRYNLLQLQHMIVSIVLLLYSHTYVCLCLMDILQYTKTS